MNWRTRRHGDIRERVVFAWLPIRCSDGQTYWLRRVHVTEQWISLQSPHIAFWSGLARRPV
jgi:hypothetical protein